MTIHLVTVGDSVRRFIRDPEGLRSPITALVNRRDRPTTLKDAPSLGVDDQDPKSVAALLTRLATGDNDTRDRAAEVLASAGQRGWPPDASAESTTFEAVTGHHTVSSTDLVVLIASDTGSGLLSAFWNAAFMLDGDLSRLRYVDDVTDGAHQALIAARGGVVLVRVGHLDMHDPDTALTAMGHLGHLARDVLRVADHPGAEEIAVHLSGGYKATIPFMIGIAEGLRSLHRDRSRVTAWVVHEAALSFPGNRTTRLPLRYLHKTAARNELQEFDAAEITTTDLSGRSLEGYAYEQVDRGWQLTPFGAGLKAMLGIAPRAL